MLRWFFTLFQRYCDTHYQLETPGFPIVSPEAERIGVIEKISHGRTSVSITGWTTYPSVGIGPPANIKWSEPSTLRYDVNKAISLPDDQRTGFELSKRVPAENCLLSFRDGETTTSIIIPYPPRHRIFLAEARLVLSFISDFLFGLHWLVMCWLCPTPANKHAAKKALRLVEKPIAPLIEKDVFELAHCTLPKEKITIIVPIYNAFEHVPECLERVSKHTDIPWRLIVVDDASTDHSVTGWLEEWVPEQVKNGKEVQLVKNQHNLGFVGSVNKALHLANAFSGHVVLLNSDAFVPDRWASRLLHPIVENPKIASVTPMSNDAEIASVPRPGVSQKMPGRLSDEIDSIVGPLLNANGFCDAPTGVGFCMALNRQYLEMLPQFDTCFGRGYGEEVDWCLRAHSLGGRNVLQPALFVEHVGNASFGKSAKSKAIHRNNRLITRRFPSFDADVQHFVNTDPLSVQRMVYAIAILSRLNRRTMLFFAHSLGGGAEHCLQTNVEREQAKGKIPLVLRVGGQYNWRLECHFPSAVRAVETDDYTLVERILVVCENFDVVYSCGVGHTSPKDIPNILVALTKTRGQRLTLLIHDYFCVSESYTLLDSNFTYKGISPLGEQDSGWRATWQTAINRADDVVCFSKCSRDIIESAFPGARGKTSIEPHSIRAVDTITPRKGSMVIGVLGDIGPQKGAWVVSALSRLDSCPGIAVIGRVDPSHPLGPKGISTGTYQHNQIVELAKSHGIRCWLIPSIWPETFSFTTHEALSTGLPVVTFDLGAQADAAKQAQNGHVAPLQLARSPKMLLHYIEKVIENGNNCKSLDASSGNRGRRGVAAG